MAKIQKYLIEPVKASIDTAVGLIKKYGNVEKSSLPELYVRLDIVRTEASYDRGSILTKKLRRRYILEHTYLHEGGLETLAYHRGWAKTEKDREGTSVEYASIYLRLNFFVNIEPLS